MGDSAPEGEGRRRGGEEDEVEGKATGWVSEYIGLMDPREGSTSDSHTRGQRPQPNQEPKEGEGNRANRTREEGGKQHNPRESEQAQAGRGTEVP